jgi:tetratricopeptide (TPR) repeat protein
MLAETEEGAGNRNAAVGVYRRVLDIDNTNLTALNNIAYALEQDNPAEALVFARQAAELAPDNPLIQDTLGWAYYRNGFYTMAVRYLEMATGKQPTALNQFHLGMSYMRGGVKPAEREMGKSMVNAALQKEPDLAKIEQ